MSKLKDFISNFWVVGLMLAVPIAVITFYAAVFVATIKYLIT